MNASFRGRTDWTYHPWDALIAYLHLLLGLSFSRSLSKVIGQRWHSLPEAGKEFYRDVAARDAQRHAQQKLQLQQQQTAAVVPQSYYMSTTSSSSEIDGDETSSESLYQYISG